MQAHATTWPTTLLARQADPVDGTVKYLFRLGDGHTVETVLMRYRYGYTACISSQVGCRMGCRFCASTIGGLTRNLSPGEMVEQLLAVNRDLADPTRRGDVRLFPVPSPDVLAAGPHRAGTHRSAENRVGQTVSDRRVPAADCAPAAPDPGSLSSQSGSGSGDRAPEAGWDRVSRLVVMGMGEPLENLEAVLSFLRVAHELEGAGIGWRHMTVSTSGLVPGIEALAACALPITLAVSLHAPNDELRDFLVPVNRRYPLAALLPACRAYVERTHRRLTFEYVMISHVNDLAEHARELTKLLRGLQCHVNLIPLNPVRERDLHCSTPEAMERFRAVLHGAGIPATVRRQLGLTIDAACGQLRRREDLALASDPSPQSV